MFFEPIYIPLALSTGTCIQQMTYFILRAYTGTTCYPQLTQENLGRGFGKKKAGKWTGRVEISKEEIPGSKNGLYGYIQTYSRL